MIRIMLRPPRAEGILFGERGAIGCLGWRPGKPPEHVPLDLRARDLGKTLARPSRGRAEHDATSRMNRVNQEIYVEPARVGPTALPGRSDKFDAAKASLAPRPRAVTDRHRRPRPPAAAGGGTIAAPDRPSAGAFRPPSIRARRRTAASSKGAPVACQKLCAVLMPTISLGQVMTSGIFRPTARASAIASIRARMVAAAVGEDVPRSLR